MLIVDGHCDTVQVALDKNVDYFYDKGVRVMSITWNEDNLLGCGVLTNIFKN